MAVGCMAVQACVTVVEAVTLDLTRLDQEQEDGQERKSAISLRFLKHFRLALLLKNWLGNYCEHWRLALYLPCIVAMTYAKTVASMLTYLIAHDNYPNQNKVLASFGALTQEP